MWQNWYDEFRMIFSKRCTWSHQQISKVLYWNSKCMSVCPLRKNFMLFSKGDVQKVLFEIFRRLIFRYLDNQNHVGFCGRQRVAWFLPVCSVWVLEVISSKLFWYRQKFQTQLSLRANRPPVKPKTFLHKISTFLNVKYLHAPRRMAGVYPIPCDIHDAGQRHNPLPGNLLVLSLKNWLQLQVYNNIHDQ